MQPFDETRDTPEADSNSSSNCDLYASSNNIQPDDQTSQNDPSLLFDGNRIGESEPQFSSESVSGETHGNPFAAVNCEAVHSTSFPNTNIVILRIPLFVLCCILITSDIVILWGFQLEQRSYPRESSYSDLEESVSISMAKQNEMPSKAVRLSNTDRLMLRKQALKMKKCPVLAVGRSNIVTGVAKAIKAHFQKYPLAIVNVKGRAKGTSVQEVVFQLEQATGGVLVSQEPWLGGI